MGRMAHTPVDPTGQQIRLTRGEVTAHIAQVGASLRGLTVDGVSIVTPYPEGERTPFGSGVVLVPWPNRVRDGRWAQTDPHGRASDEQLAITEPKLDNAIHGLLRYAPYAIEQSEGAATLTATVVPQAGYPFALVTQVVYELTDDGIRVTHRLTNVGAHAAPAGVGTHPFFHIGGVDTEDLRLKLPAATWFETDDRLLPTAEKAVSGDTDLRAGARVGDLDLDTAFGTLSRDADGRASSTLEGPDGQLVTVWQDADFDYLQVFTTDAFPGQSRAIAIEPMTMPADALNSGQGLRWVEPGETWELSWGVTYSG